MEASYYWLISITTETVSVALVERNSPDVLLAIGPETEWLSDNPDSFLHSVDISLSEAAQKAALEPEQEPESSAFILPPKWIGNDGKIFPEFLKLLESLCHSLKLKPLGFISNDETFIEALNKEDSFPPSFILVYLGRKEFSLSLVYLGEVKKRFYQNLTNDFSPQDLENALVNIRLDSALPPRILVFGHLSPSIIDDLKNYSWIGKQNIETFLHLPDVKAYQREELFTLYSHTVSSQIGNTPSPIIIDNKVELPSQPIIENKENQNEIIEDETISTPDEVPPEELGFSEIIDSDSIVLPSPPLPSEEKLSPKTEFHFPKISLPHLNFRSWFLFPLALSPLLILIPYYLIKAEVVINFKAVEINKNFNLTLDSGTTAISTITIPVVKKSFDLKFTESLPTTGQKETGDKAKGEITIFNKIDKIQNTAKGTIIMDGTGKKYELLTSIQVPASTFNLATGTITMGQTKANAIASDIGSEFNLNKDVLLSFKDNVNLLAKVNDSISGGTRRQIRVVSTEDKNKLNKIVTDSFNPRILKNNTDNSLPGLMLGTLYIDKKQQIYNREIGEEADTLEVNVTLTYSLFQIDPNQKENILKTLLANDQQFLQSTASSSDFSFSFEATQNSSQKSTGKLTITGQTLPKIDTNTLLQNLAGKTIDNAYKIIESQPKVYNRKITISPPIFAFLNRLPPTPNKITIIEKF